MVGIGDSFHGAAAVGIDGKKVLILEDSAEVS